MKRLTKIKLQLTLFSQNRDVNKEPCALVKHLLHAFLHMIYIQYCKSRTQFYFAYNNIRAGQVALECILTCKQFF